MEPLTWLELVIAIALLVLFGLVWSRIFLRAGCSGWWLLALLIPLVNLCVMIWAVGRILAKAGYNGLWGLVVLLPIVNAVVILMLAFGKWPRQRGDI